MQAWDGWCNYGIAENPAIKFVLPKEGSDLWVDTMVIIEQLAEPGSGAQIHRLRAAPGERRSGSPRNILYKVPNKAAMEALDPALLEQYPNLAIAPPDMLKLEELRDLGPAQKMYSRAVDGDHVGAVVTDLGGGRHQTTPSSPFEARSLAPQGEESTVTQPSGRARLPHRAWLRMHPVDPHPEVSRRKAGLEGSRLRLAMTPTLRRAALMAPGLGWLALFLLVPCALVLGLSFFERGVYGGVDYIFTLRELSAAPSTRSTGRSS